MFTKIIFIFLCGFLFFGTSDSSEISDVNKNVNNKNVEGRGNSTCDPNTPAVKQVPLYVYNTNGVLVKLTFDKENITEKDREHLKELADNIEFYLYTKNNLERIYINQSEILKFTQWDSKKPTIISTHGFQSSSDSDACQVIKDAYLNIMDANVILMNWKEIAAKSYVTAVVSVKYVGRTVGNMINFLLSMGMNADTTTIIGHSLGAHVMGIAASYSKDLLYYVVGLDPAGPLFEFGINNITTIHAHSGKYVHIYHTNAGQLGAMERLGQKDFYLNYKGSLQPGCPFNSSTSPVCSHSFSYYFFSKAIQLQNTNDCIAKRCSSWSCFTASMCNDTKTAIVAKPELDRELIGNYYLKTSDKPPYCLGDCGILLKNPKCALARKRKN